MIASCPSAATVLVRHSHIMPLLQLEEVQPSLKEGDLLLLDNKLFHRGVASEQARSLFYISRFDTSSLLTDYEERSKGVLEFLQEKGTADKTPGHFHGSSYGGAWDGKLRPMTVK